MNDILDTSWVSISPVDVAYAIDRNGWAIARGMIDVGEAEKLGAGVEKAFDAFDSQDPLNPWHVPFASKAAELSAVRGWVRNRGGVFAADSPPMLAQLIDAYRRLGVIDWVRDYFGEQPVLSSHKTTLRLTHPDTPSVGWHQDGAFLGENARVLNIWLALTPCGEDAVGLDLAVRRQKAIVGAGEDGAAYDWSVSDTRAAREAGNVISPVLKSGDAILFDHLCLHRTGALSATKTRKAIEAWFFAPSTLPDNYDALPLQ